MRHRLTPIAAASGLVLVCLGGATFLPAPARAEITSDSLLGPGLRSRPAYDGSASRRLELVPVVRDLRHPWFARSTQGIGEAGVRIEWIPGLHVGAQLAYEPGRPTSESDFLRQHRVTSVSRGASVGLQLEWDHAFGPMPVTLLLRTRQHTRASRGAEADVRLSAGIYQGAGLGLGLFTQAGWANAQATRSIYGIGEQESIITGLAAFRPGGGWQRVGLGLLASLNLGPTWVMVGSLEARRLQGDAAQSPLTERRSDVHASVGLAWHY